MTDIANNNIEKIGNVTLNLTYYDGNDYYSEGQAEDVLLDLVSRYKESDYEHVIQNSRSWNVMYHLSHIRENVITWLPISKKANVLEIGSGCGAITGALAKMTQKVTCIELSKKRSMINATRHKEYNNIEIMVGNFQNIEPNLTEKYDVITLIGVLEYGASYIDSEDPYNDFISKVKSHLAPGGKIIIAIENKYGLKYFAGCKEDHTGKYFEGIEGYTGSNGVNTFSNSGLAQLMENNGLNYKFFYPYPDYKLPNAIYSDDFLPKPGELNTNLRNYDNDRIVLFDECKAFDSIIDDNNFPFFANSYIVVASNEEVTNTLKVMPVFAKYANERVPKYRSATIIYVDKENKKLVYKISMSNEANNHIKSISDNYEKLLADYDGTKFIPNRCQYIEGKEPAPLVAGATSKAIDTLFLEYLSGVSLEKYLYLLSKDGKYEKVLDVMKEYVSIVCSLSKGAVFRQTERFKNVFGNRKFNEIYTGKSNSNYDLIFSNIIFDKDKGPEGPWNILDYEWTFDFPIPDKFLAFRGVYYFAEFSDSGIKEYFEKLERNIYEELGFSQEEVKIFTDMEHSFQVFIIGGAASLEVLHAMMPTSTIFVDKLLKVRESLKNLNNPKIYYSFGQGFSEDKRLYIIPQLDGTKVSMDIPIKSNMRSIRIDPTEYPSVVSVSEISLINEDDSVTEINRFLMNGYGVSDKTIIFDTDDAQIIVNNITGKEKLLRISYEITMFPEKIYNDMRDMAKEKQRTDYKEDGIVNKAMKKLHLKGRFSSAPEGYHYNV